MKFRIKPLIISGVFVLAATMLPLSVVVANAHEGEHDEATTTTTTTSTEEDAKPNPAELKARLEARKTALKTRIDAAKQARIKSRCKAAQGGISNIRGRIKGLETSRSHVYENLLSRLEKLNERLKANNVDTAVLETQLTELHTLIDTFNADLAAYKLAVSDLADMDCVAEPVAFQASLEEARTARTKAVESAKAIKTYLSETIKPTLKDLKAQFAQNSGDKEETEQQTEDEGGEE